MIYCTRELSNLHEFYCSTVCENKRNYICCPFRKTAQIQLTLHGNPADNTPVVLAKRRRRALQNPNKFIPEHTK